MRIKRGPEASIIILTWNQKKFIEKSLPVIFSQKFRDFEVIIVDSGSTDGTLKLMKEYPVKIIQYQGPVGKDFNYAKAFNLGGKKAKGKFLVRLSGDAIPANIEWLTKLLVPFSDPMVAGTYSRQVYGKEVGSYQKALSFFLFSRFHGLFEKLACRIMFNGASCVLRKKIWQEIPFNEGVKISEDVVWSLAVAKRGYRTVYAPESLIEHTHFEPITKMIFKDYFWQSTKVVFRTYLEALVALIK